MRRYLACDCGFEVVSVDLDELVDAARRHAVQAHAMELSAEQLISIVRPLAGSADAATSSVRKALHERHIAP
jgi:predicted small metal-binding protein